MLKIIIRFIIALLVSVLVGCGRAPQDKLVETQTVPLANNQGNIWAQTRYEPTHVDMQLMQVSEHVYYVQGPPGAPGDNDGFMSNAGVIITAKGVVIFDALGSPPLAHLLRSKIKEKTDQPIVKVIVSHYHADHIYGLQVFNEGGAQILAPLGAKTYLASDAAEGRLKERRESLFPWVNDETRLVHPDRYIDKVQTLTMGKVTIKIKPLGSTHSDGDLSVMVEPDKVLLIGDLVFEGRIPFVAGSKPQRWLENLAAIKAKGIKTIIPGHGPASAQPEQAVQFTQGYIQYLNDTMGQAVEDLVPFDEVYNATDWTRYKKYPAFQVNRRNAYYMYLALEGASVGE